MAAQAEQLLLACNQQSGVVINGAAVCAVRLDSWVLSQKDHVVCQTMTKSCEDLPHKALTECYQHLQYFNVCVFPQGFECLSV